MEQSEILQYLAELTGIEGHAFHRAILLEVVVWFVMIAAVIIDFSTGIRKARVLKIPRDSHGFRRSFEKFGDYGKVPGIKNRGIKKCKAKDNQIIIHFSSVPLF